MDDLPSSFDEIRSQLRLRIMPRTFTSLHPLGATTPLGILNDRLACTPLAADLDVCLVLDKGVSSAFLPRLLLETWRVHTDEALQVAVDNRTRQPGYGLTRRGKLWIYSSGDGYALAELLVDERRRDELPAASSLVALMPEENTLLVAPADDASALRDMFTIAYERAQRSRRLCSARPIELREEHWQEFTPPAQVKLALARVRRHIDATHYTRQLEVLQPYFQRQGSNTVISQLMIARNAVTQERFSFTNCSFSAGTLIPEADVLVYTARDDIYHMRWPDVIEHAPSSVECVGWWPPLWRVHELPDAPGLRKCTSPDELFGVDGERPARAQ